MDITRRELITTIAKAGVPAAVAITIGAGTLHAETENIPFPTPPSDYSMTPASASVAKPAWRLVPKPTTPRPIPAVTRLHQAPSDLNDLTRNIIKLYKPEDGSPSSFVKRQCMHCLDPACAAGCPFQALHKDPEIGHRELDGRGMHRLPLLHHHLSLSRSALSVAGIQPARDQVRVVQPPPGARA